MTEKSLFRNQSRLKSVRAKGFTLVELLVVISIIGVLVALLLPAVQAAREAARRIQCTNNLKQLGLALLNFESSQDELPPSAVTNEFGREVYGNSNRSCFVFLLPYMEQQTLADMFVLGTGTNFSDRRNWEHQVNRPFYQNVLPSLQCPTTPTGDRLLEGLSTSNRPYRNAGPTDYSLYYWVAVGPLSAEGLGLIEMTYDGRDAALKRNEKNSFRSITDGTSNTLVFVESAGKTKVYNSQGIIQTDVSGKDLRVEGGAWADNFNLMDLRGSSVDGQTLGGVCAINCTNLQEAYAFHPGGANAVFADGSVHFINDNIPIAVMSALVTRANSETLSTPDF